MLPDFVFEWTEGGMFLFILLVTGTIALAAHLLLCWRRTENLRTSIESLSPVLQALCGTMFALAVTFLASSVWQTEDNAKQLVNEEARSIRLIRIYIDETPESGRDQMRKLLSDYVDAVSTEWATMETAEGAPAAEKRLAEIYDATVKRLTGDQASQNLQQHILAALDNLSRARQERLTIAQEHVSDGQWFTVLCLAFLLIVVIATCHANSAPARAVALTFITVAIAISLFIILAHDRPFVGRLAISPQPILDAAGTGS